MKNIKICMEITLHQERFRKIAHRYATREDIENVVKGFNTGAKVMGNIVTGRHLK